LGYIAQTAILPAFAQATDNSQLAALVSGTPGKLRRLSEKYKVEHSYSYEQYADCLKSGAIDAVYIGLPNHLHKKYAVAAAQAGIHVLCEKPLAFGESDSESMIAAARDAGVKLMPAYCTHFEPATSQLVEAIHAGKIGEPRIFTSTFSQKSRPGRARLNNHIWGNVLYDLGIYCINTACCLFGAEPGEVYASGLNFSDKQSMEPAEMFVGQLNFANHRVASFVASLGTVDRSTFEVIGTRGILKMDPAYEVAKDLKSEISIGDWRIKEIFRRRDEFASALLYFSDCVLKDKEPQPSGEMGLADVRIIRALILSAETNSPVSLPQISCHSPRNAPHKKVIATDSDHHQWIRTASSAAD
jgi:predicted dehydrogenase